MKGKNTSVLRDRSLSDLENYIDYFSAVGTGAVILSVKECEYNVNQFNIFLIKRMYLNISFNGFVNAVY